MNRLCFLLFIGLFVFEEIPAVNINRRSAGKIILHNTHVFGFMSYVRPLSVRHVRDFSIRILTIVCFNYSIQSRSFTFP